MATRNYVLQRCTRIGRQSTTWETVCMPVSRNEGLAQLAAVNDHHRPHRLVQGVKEAMRIGATLREASPC